MDTKKAKEFVDDFNAIHHKWLVEVGAHEEQRLHKSGITMPQFFTLYSIGNQELMMKEVAGRLCLSMAAASGVIERLVKIGLVDREHDSEDRRKVKIKLTAEGRKVLKKVETERDKKLSEFFLKVSENDAKKFLAMFDRLLEKISTEK